MKRLTAAIAACALVLATASWALAQRGGHGRGGHGHGGHGHGGHGHGGHRHHHGGHGHWHGGHGHGHGHWHGGHGHWHSGVGHLLGHLYNGYGHGYGYYPRYSSYYYPSYSSGYYSYYPSQYYGSSYYPSQYYGNGGYQPEAYGNGAYRAPLTSAPVQRTSIQVILPDPEAVVTFDGHRTSSVGRVRTFEPSGLQPGQSYTYKVEIAWQQNGRQLRDLRNVQVSANQSVVVDFTQPAAEALPPAGKPVADK